ncbi:MAG: hypothetical protein UX17_C0030G0013 [Parcubacteria group bacterium GW2011_GWC2_45_7]|nr:MAG: hypothetical protein UX17_C0030G0013 [Parcubacteria group bacterium GW2011_GWC2_45_7]KKU74008.1 MAG: hypothetical protein UX98_C0002G0038 [Parcubacteria group bacterium GW2011_GWA2_47_26]
MPNMQRINSKEYAEQVKTTARNLAIFGDRAGAFEFARAIQELLKNPELNAEVRPLYEDAERDALFAAIPVLPDREVLQGLEKHLAYYLGQENYDLLSVIKSKLSGIDIVEERDAFRAMLRDSLMNADGKISEKIELLDGSQEGSPRNWLSYYLQTVGGVIPDTFKRTEFIASRPVEHAKPVEQARLKRLIELFDYLRLSSATGAGFEEELVADFDERIMILQDGKVTQIDPKTDEIMSKTMPAMLTALKQAWARQAAQPTDLEKEAREQAKSLNPAQSQQTIAEIFTAKSSKDQKNGLAALYGAIGGGLDIFLKQILPTLQAHLKDAPEAERSASLLQSGLITPAVAKIFLRIYLEKLLGFSMDHAAALVGRMLGTLSPAERDKYFKVAYYDFEKGWFVWGEV